MFEGFDFFYTLYMFCKILPLIGCVGCMICLIMELKWGHEDSTGMWSVSFLVVMAVLGLSLSDQTYRLYQKYGDILKYPVINERQPSIIFYK